MPDLLSLSGLLLIVAALVVGISKTSVSGFGSFAVAAFALVMPAKESTAAVLLLLIIGDIVAVLRYRKHCNWALLRRLLPSVLPGVALGAWVLSVISDVVLKRGIGVLLVIFTGVLVREIGIGVVLALEEKTRHWKAPKRNSHPSIER